VIHGSTVTIVFPFQHEMTSRAKWIICIFRDSLTVRQMFKEKGKNEVEKAHFSSLSQGI